MKLVPEIILQRYIQDQFEQFQSAFLNQTVSQMDKDAHGW